MKPSCFLHGFPNVTKIVVNSWWNKTYHPNFPNISCQTVSRQTRDLHLSIRTSTTSVALDTALASEKRWIWRVDLGRFVVVTRVKAEHLPTNASLETNNIGSMINVRYIYTSIYHKNQPNVGKYAIHWVSGIRWLVEHLLLMAPYFHVRTNASNPKWWIKIGFHKRFC